MLADLECVRAELDVVVDQSEDGREGPDNAPHSDVSELRDHLGVVGCILAFHMTLLPSHGQRRTEQSVLWQRQLSLHLVHEFLLDLCLAAWRGLLSVVTAHSLFDRRFARPPVIHEAKNVRQHVFEESSNDYGVSFALLVGSQ